ncbi:long-chain-fatty-acid--CoA ligase [Jeotgalibacillus sp. R-1-5s-1]|uniref:long-chain-fatty-acid--CoA ligase n=1 Tax=Jeotgalibacillus sp. R-1-5s-1 TaxID=2555897 RepID=UPI00106A209B|nr:long-chain-fatty-acid--CoA ligase [Jeotgalibacillus sp. R-1-5s-1]TFE02462.1 long-chain-fatty-acid--CoA ligase [Jeotgalibacillus sp. R-1-5s-1]
MHVPLILTDFLDRAVTLYGGKTAVIDGERSLTYRDIEKRVNQLSRGLAELGIKKGDKVAYLTPNSLEMFEGFYGLYQVGAVMTSLNTRLRPEDYQFILNHSESKVLFVDADLYPLIESIRTNLETVHTFIIQGRDAEGCLSYEKWLSGYSEEAYDRVPLEETDIASLLYTSGTTGDPKGVLLSHRSNYLHALTTMHHLKISDQDTLLHVLPMFHVNGWGSPFYYTANGATQVMQRKVDPKAILENVAKHQVSIMHMAPTVLNMLIEEAAHTNAKFDHALRVVIAGSAPPPAFVRKVEEELGWEFIQVYGMTEISPLVTMSAHRSNTQVKDAAHSAKLKSKTGYELIGSKVRVLDELGVEVPHDGKAIGEIAVRSNNVMEGYFKNPEATSAAIRDGWLYTGDMAIVDDQGYIEIVDRKKDVIISGGENISSIEVEAALYDHPAILEAAVIAVPHEKWGEVPHAVIVKREGYELTEEEVIAFANEKLARFKIPKSFSFTDQLPKTASGKIQKVVLRKEFWDKDGKMVN